MVNYHNKEQEREIPSVTRLRLYILTQVLFLNKRTTFPFINIDIITIFISIKYFFCVKIYRQIYSLTYIF